MFLLTFVVSCHSTVDLWEEPTSAFPKLSLLVVMGSRSILTSLLLLMLNWPHSLPLFSNVLSLVHNKLRSLCWVGCTLCVSLSYWEAQNWTSPPGVFSPVLSRDEESHSSVFWWHSPNTAQKFLPNSTPRFLSRELLPCQSVFSHRESSILTEKGAKYWWSCLSAEPQTPHIHSNTLGNTQCKF